MTGEEYVYNEHDEPIGIVESVQVEGKVRYIPYGMFADYSEERLAAERTFRDALRAIRKWQRTWNMSEKLDPEKIAPTGKWAYLLEQDIDHQEWPEQVRDYSKETIESYVYPTMVADHRTADYFSEWVWQTLNDWGEGTEQEVMWGEIIQESLEMYKEKIFPTQEGKE